MKTAILIHGCHLLAKDWDKIVWGDPRNGIFGRASKGINITICEKPEVVYWGTGASEKNGVKESEYTLSYAITRARELSYFENRTAKVIEEALRKISFVDTESQNTKEEVSKCMEMCKERRIEKLILVSSPDHIGRCFSYANDLRSEKWETYKGLQVSAIASDVRFFESMPGDVLYVEPSHRGDRSGISLHKTLRLAMFARKLPDKQALQFNEELVSFLEEQQKRYLK